MIQYEQTPPIGPSSAGTFTADVLVRDALLVEPVVGPAIPGGWVAITDGFVSGLGEPGTEPRATVTLDATDCLVTPGLVNTHHHIFQNLTRAFAPVTRAPFAEWLTALGPVWERMDEEAAYVATWIGLAELALGGCTTTSDNHYIHPLPRLIDAQIAAAREVGLRFHPARGSFDLAEEGQGSMPRSLAETPDDVLGDCERLVAAFHDPAPGAMVQIAFGPGTPYGCSRELMTGSRELAERLGVRLHTHLAQVPDEEDYCRAQFGCRPVELLDDLGWASDRAWVAHCIFPTEEDIATLGRTGTGVAHCPSSNMMICEGIAPVIDLRSAGVPVGLGCDGSASTDHANMWLEARTALLLGRLRGGASAMGARDALEIATIGGAACLGRSDIGALAPGMVGDLVAWPLTGVRFAGAWTDPVETWLRCGPVLPRHTVVAGQPIVRDGNLVLPGVDERLAQHERISRTWQRSVLPHA